MSDNNNVISWFEIPVTDFPRAEPAGGKVLMPKMEIGNDFGFFAHFLDSEANRAGLHSMA